MKKVLLCLFTLAGSVFLNAYTGSGGDSFTLFWNGKQLHQQHVLTNKEVKTLKVSAASEKDQLEVMYSHCGQPGKNRTVVFRDEKKKQLATFRYADRRHHSRMAVAGKSLVKMNAKNLYLYYRSNELPTEQLLTIIQVTKEPSLSLK